MASVLIGDVTYREGGRATQDDTSAAETRIYLVETDNPNEPKASIVAATGVPIYAPNPDDPNQLSQNYDIANYRDEPLQWLVRITFSSEATQDAPEDPDPLNRAVQIKINRVAREDFIWQDINGNAITNINGEFFEDFPAITASGRRIQFEKNFTNQASPSWVLTHENTLNDADIKIKGVTYPEKTCKMNMIGITYDLWENQIDYDKVEWEIEYRNEGWSVTVLERGYYENIAPQGLRHIRIPFDDSTGTALDYDNPKRKKVSSPWPLNALGEAVQNPNDPMELTYATFEVYSTSDFTVMPGVTVP